MANSNCRDHETLKKPLVYMATMTESRHLEKRIISK